MDAFSAIARACSFRIAAEHLNPTQPAISMTLKELGRNLRVVCYCAVAKASDKMF